MKTSAFLLFMICNVFCCLAKGDLNDNATQLSSKFPTQSYSKIQPRYGGGTRSAYFFFSAKLGYSAGKSTVGNITTQKGGLEGGMEAGVRIAMRSNSNNLRLLSFSLGANSVTMPRVILGTAILPVTFSNVSEGQMGNGVGFFWQLGLTEHYLYSIDENKKITGNKYNKIFVEPTADFGINFPFTIVSRRGGEELGHGRFFIGPHAGYIASNMLSNGTMHGYTIGLRVQYLF